MPEALWQLSVDQEHIELTAQDGTFTRLEKSALRGVIVETNDSGPWGADVWWLLFGVDDTVALAYPQGATGEQAVLDWLIALPGFDQEAMIRAMGSTRNAVFPVWRKAD